MGLIPDFGYGTCFVMGSGHCEQGGVVQQRVVESLILEVRFAQMRQTETPLNRSVQFRQRDGLQRILGMLQEVQFTFAD